MDMQRGPNPDDSPHCINIGLSYALDIGQDDTTWGDVVRVIEKSQIDTPKKDTVIDPPQEPGQKIQNRLVSEWFQLAPVLVPMVDNIKAAMNRESNNNSWTIPIASELNKLDIDYLCNNLKTAGFNVAVIPNRLDPTKREITINMGEALEKGADNFVWGEALRNIAEGRKQKMEIIQEEERESIGSKIDIILENDAAQALSDLKRARVGSFDQTMTNPDAQNRSPNLPSIKKRQRDTGSGINTK